MYGRTKDEQTLALGAASTIHSLRRGLSDDKKNHEHLVLDYPSQVRCPVLTQKPEHLRLGNGINWDAPRLAQRSINASVPDLQDRSTHGFAAACSFALAG